MRTCIPYAHASFNMITNKTKCASKTNRMRKRSTALVPSFKIIVISQTSYRKRRALCCVICFLHNVSQNILNTCCRYVAHLINSMLIRSSNLQNNIWYSFFGSIHDLYSYADYNRVVLCLFMYTPYNQA